MLIADDNLTTLWSETMTEIHWIKAKSLAEVFDALAVEDIDLILLDLWLGYESLEEMLMNTSGSAGSQLETNPLALSSISLGREILREVHVRRSDIPCFLLSMNDPEHPTVDDEFFLSCVRSGGARGLIRTGFVADGVESWVEQRNLLQIELSATAERMWRENKARQLGHEHRHLAFDTAPQLSEDGRTIHIKLRDLRLERFIVAQDAAELLDNVERPSLGFDDVFGGDTAKSELRHIVDWFVDRLHEPKQLEPMHCKSPRSILLHGKPGTGKTMLARALAGQAGAAFVAISATSFVREWQENGPQSVRNLFARAYRYAPAIIFVDEIDAIANNQDDASGEGAAFEKTLNALLFEMDGFVFPPAQPTIFIAATNLIETLDNGLTRRFDRVIELEPPDRRARLRFLEQRLIRTGRHRISPAVIDRLAGQTATRTISDLERLVECALRIAAQSNGTITDEILEDAFAATQIGETQKINDGRSLLHIARHEAGHALVGWLTGNRPNQISILARNSVRGSVERDLASKYVVFDKPELETMIRQLMAGRAGEMLYYGDNEGLSSSARSDLETATQYAELMVRHYGMDPVIGPVYLDARRFNDGPIVMEVMHAASRILKEQLNEAREILEAHREMLDTLVDHLLKWNRLTTEELEEILG